MKVKVNISDPVEVSAELDLPRLTLFIGPNLNGKSTVLKCIFTAMKGKRYWLTLRFNDVEGCEVDEEVNYVLYADPYMVTYYLYDKYKQYFLMAEEAERLSELAEIGRDVRGPVDDLLEFKSLIPDDYLAEAGHEVDKVLEKLHDELREAGHEEEWKYLLPLRVYVTKDGIEWRDVFEKKGEGVTNVTPFFYPAFIVTATTYAYAMSKKRKVVLLLDEPEAFSYPSAAYTMGRIFRHLSEKSDNLYIIAITHSWDLYAGAEKDRPEWVEVYTYKREGKKVSIEPLRKGLYIPGFSVSGLLA